MKKKESDLQKLRDINLITIEMNQSGEDGHDIKERLAQVSIAIERLKSYRDYLTRYPLDSAFSISAWMDKFKDSPIDAETKNHFHKIASNELHEFAIDLLLMPGFKVSSNKAGPAVLGEVTLMGMINESVGIYVVVGGTNFYRSIKNMSDYTGGENHNLEHFIKAESWKDGVTDYIVTLNKSTKHQRSLDEKRSHAAQRFYETSNLGGYEVQDASGWEWVAGSNEVGRVLFIKRDEGDEREGTRAVILSLHFHEHSSNIESAFIDGKSII